MSGQPLHSADGGGAASELQIVTFTSDQAAAAARLSQCCWEGNAPAPDTVNQQVYQAAPELPVLSVTDDTAAAAPGARTSFTSDGSILTTDQSGRISEIASSTAESTSTNGLVRTVQYAGDNFEAERIQLQMPSAAPAAGEEDEQQARYQAWVRQYKDSGESFWVQYDGNHVVDTARDITLYDDGTMLISHCDGTEERQNANGTSTRTAADGRNITRNADQTVVETSPDGNSMLRRDASGRPTDIASGSDRTAFAYSFDDDGNMTQVSASGISNGRNFTILSAANPGGASGWTLNETRESEDGSAEVVESTRNAKSFRFDEQSATMQYILDNGRVGAIDSAGNLSERNPNPPASAWFMSQSRDRELHRGLFACAPTSMLMALAYRGLAPNNEEARRAMIDETGTNTAVGLPNRENLVAAARRRGLPAENITEHDLGSVDRALNAGQVLVVNGFTSGEGHFIFVAGRDANGDYIVGDPINTSPSPPWTRSQLYTFMNTGNKPKGFVAIGSRQSH